VRIGTGKMNRAGIGCYGITAGILGSDREIPVVPAFTGSE